MRGCNVFLVFLSLLNCALYLGIDPKNSSYVYFGYFFYLAGRIPNNNNTIT